MGTYKVSQSSEKDEKRKISNMRITRSTINITVYKCRRCNYVHSSLWAPNIPMKCPKCELTILTNKDIENWRRWAASSLLGSYLICA